MQVGDSSFAEPLSRNLSVEVAAPFVRGAHVAQDQRHCLFDKVTRPIEANRRDDESFLDQLARDGHRAGSHAADIGLVRATGDVSDRFVALCGAVSEDRRDHGHVRQMRAAEERVVEDREIARLPRREPLDRAH